MTSRSRSLLRAIVLILSSYAPTAFADEGWVSLFDGKTLDGWKVNGGFASYKVEDGAIVGTTAEGSPNTFLCKGDYKDFVLELEVRCDPRLNSGVQVRSHVYEKDTPQESDPKRVRKAGTVYGPQCEIAESALGVSGNFWDEARRTRWLDDFAKRPAARAAFKDGEWNRYRIVVQGNRYRSWINGVAASGFTDDTDTSGFIGLQVHSIAKGQGPYQVRWRNVRIRPLEPGEPVRKAAARPGEILRITTRPEWEKARADGAYRGDTLATEGFIHCATPKQLPWVVETFYQGRTGLVVLRIEPGKLTSPLKWESPPDSKEEYPHVYGPIDVRAVVEVVLLEDLLSDGN